MLGTQQSCLGEIKGYGLIGVDVSLKGSFLLLLDKDVSSQLLLQCHTCLLPAMLPAMMLRTLFNCEPKLNICFYKLPVCVLSQQWKRDIDNFSSSNSPSSCLSFLCTYRITKVQASPCLDFKACCFVFVVCFEGAEIPHVMQLTLHEI